MSRSILLSSAATAAALSLVASASAQVEGGSQQSVETVVVTAQKLAEAHGMGIVHRDLKPSTLFIIKRLDGSPAVK